MSELKKHTVPGQALGYYFQLERALSWLAKSPCNSVIGIETEDDVVVELSNGAKIYEQDKSSSASNFPFETNKIDFWKTLLIWLEALKYKEISCEEPHPTFYMVTNKTASHQLVREIGSAQTNIEVQNALKKLRAASANTPKGIENTVNKVIAFNDIQLSYLIKHIVFVDGENSISKDELISDLQLTNDGDVEYYINSLTGYIFNLTVDAWRNKKPALISREDFVRLKNTLITDRFTTVFNEEAINVAEIAISNEESNENSNYIKQLKLIELNNDGIREAIVDYLKSTEARTIMAKKGYIGEQSFLNANNELTRRWDTIFGQKKRLKIPYKWDDIQIGQEIYDATLDYKAMISGYQTKNYYLTKGIYHLLANNLTVGWHPNYKEIITQNNNEEDT